MRIGPKTPLSFCAARGMLLLALGCAGVETSSEAAPAPGVPVPASALGPGDVFEVRVYGEQDLSGTFRVASDGSINFPLVGRIVVSGLTASAASEVLANSLTAYVKRPNVSLFVKEYNSKKIYVFGQVKRPGTFPYEEGMNIIQAITLAGGFDRMADQDGTFVTRIIEGREKRLEVSVRQIGEGKAPNLQLEPGDIVYVPESIF